MAKNVIINGVTYNSVPRVNIPISGGGIAQFYDISDATLDSGNKMLDGVTAYAAGTKYTGSIQTKTTSDLTVSGATITAPAGYYASSASKTVATGGVSVPATSITANPSISVSSSGLITATTAASQSVSPSITEGYITTGTAGTITVSGSTTEQLITKAATPYTPTTSDQTIAAETYLTGAQTIKGDSNLQAQNIASGVTIFGVTGSLTTPVISQDGTTKVLSIS